MSTDEQLPEHDTTHTDTAVDTGTEIDADTDIDTAVDTGESRTAGRPPRWLVLGSAALASATFVAAAFFGIQWWRAASGNEVEIAQAREDVVATTHTAILAFTNLDYVEIDRYFGAQKRLATSEFDNAIGETERTFRDALVQAKTKVTATVQDVGVEEINVHAGKASVLATVQTIRTMDGQADLNKNMRLQVQLERVSVDGTPQWLVANLGEVP